MIRIGNGFDVHRFAPDRRLVLGGVDISAEQGLLGHSDADVLTHAVMDALLGALALGDIGKWFPDNNQEYKNADSLLLLKKILGDEKLKDWKIGNLDCTIIAQKPRLAEYIDAMRKNLAVLFNAPLELLSVKATTTEKLGFCGREEGIAVITSILMIDTQTEDSEA